MKPTEEVQAILNNAYSNAKEEGHEYITPEHLLFVSLRYELPRMILQECDVDTDILHDNLINFFTEHLEKVKDTEPILTEGGQNIIERTILHMHTAGKESITSADLLVAIYDLETSFASYYLRKAGIKRIRLLEAVSHRPEKINRDENETLDSSEHNNAASPQDPKKISSLQKFAVDLTDQAEKGKLEPLIGRADILERTMQVLCRRLKNNPVHVGDPGVGKTAITEGLARRIVDGQVPRFLANHRIWSLNMGSLIAGTRYRGDFEERIKNLLLELKEQKNAILFIDEIHTVIGAGATSNGNMDAANLLKPALMSGKIRCIGSTTYEEFKKIFTKDHALARRFQRIDVPETTRDETLQILKGLRGVYEAHHCVSYSDNALQTAVDLSDQFINEKYLPDKAIDLIDEAGAWKHLHAEMSSFSTDEAKLQDNHEREMVFDKNKEKGDDAALPTSVELFPDKISSSISVPQDKNTLIPTVDSEDIEKVLSKIARIPEKTINAGESERLLYLADALKSQIFGQNEAIDAVAAAIKQSRAGFRKPDKPVASFLFVGPTGVGKTELARTLADELGVSLHRFDMSEYQEKHTVSRLIGSPPGYVGYDDGGILTDVIRKNPHSVLLLDEMEKAHQDIYNVLLQMMDYATLTDNMGRKADFRNVVIIMTSNAGAREMGKIKIGFGEEEEGETTFGALDKAVEQIFPPEFRNRLDKVVRFNRLGFDIIENIVHKEIRQFQDMLESKDIQLDVTAAAVKWIAQKGHSSEFGARNIARVVKEKIKAFFVDEVLFGSLSNGGHAIADVEGDDIRVRTTTDAL